jgi:hypothetical protein
MVIGDNWIGCAAYVGVSWCDGGTFSVTGLKSFLAVWQQSYLSLLLSDSLADFQVHLE